MSSFHAELIQRIYVRGASTKALQRLLCVYHLPPPASIDSTKSFILSPFLLQRQLELTSFYFRWAGKFFQLALLQFAERLSLVTRMGLIAQRRGNLYKIENRILQREFVEEIEERLFLETIRGTLPQRQRIPREQTFWQQQLLEVVLLWPTTSLNCRVFYST